MEPFGGFVLLSTTLVLVNITVVDGRFAICRLDADAPLPPWAGADSTFVSCTRTNDELSIVCDELRVPDGVSQQRGWALLMVEGPLELSLTGVLASVANPLNDAGGSIFTVSTYETDYVLVPGASFATAIRALDAAGHTVLVSESDGHGPQERSLP